MRIRPLVDRYSFIALLAAVPIFGCSSAPPDSVAPPPPTVVSLQTLSSEIRTRVERHVEGLSASVAPTWKGARLAENAREVHRVGMEGPAYYEFKVESATGKPVGYVIATAGDHDFPIVQFDVGEKTPTERALPAGARMEDVSRVYRVGTDTILEKSDGTVLGSTSRQMDDVEWHVLREAKTTQVADSFRTAVSEAWKSERAAISLPSTPTLSPQLGLDGQGLGGGPGNVSYVTRSCGVQLPIPNYDQLPPNASDPRNPRDYWSGCGPTAWAMLLAWADNQASNGDPRWAYFGGLFRQGGVANSYAIDARAPLFYGDPYVAPAMPLTSSMNLTLGLGNFLGTSSSGDDHEGGTTTWSMHSGIGGYLDAVALNGQVAVDWDGLTNVTFGYIRDNAAGDICNNHTPTIVGFNINQISSREGQHVSLASSYMEWNNGGKYFYVNTGWGGDNNGWFALDVSFRATLRPTMNSYINPPWSQSFINVRKATWGKNCAGVKVGVGNVTNDAAYKCDGKQTCTYKLDPTDAGRTLVGGLDTTSGALLSGKLENPAPACAAKNLDLEWYCGNDGTVRTAHVDGEASGTSTTLDCTCHPTTCAAQGKTCGTISNGCGATLNCGPRCGYSDLDCPCGGVQGHCKLCPKGEL